VINNKYIKLFSCYIPVKGYSRSALCNIHRNEINLIPNALFDLIPFFDTLNIDELENHYGIEYRNIIAEYLEYLINNYIGFYCEKNELESFPLINISRFHTPFTITNSIVELDKISIESIKAIINELNSVQCLSLEIRIFNRIELQELELMLSLFNDPDVQVNELHCILQCNDYIIDDLKKLFYLHARLTRIIVCNSANNDLHTNFFDDRSQIVFTKRKIHLPTCCGNFAPEQFTINLPFFTESQHHNTCLHRKVAIDKDGNIKNCPSMAKSFGNIKDTKLVEVIENKEFTAKWNITKDQISICQDCEFRHVCMDCRAYLEDPNDDYSKPLKCGYDPYTMEWEDWSQNPLKKLTMKHYNMKDL